MPVKQLDDCGGKTFCEHSFDAVEVIFYKLNVFWKNIFAMKIDFLLVNEIKQIYFETNSKHIGCVQWD